MPCCYSLFPIANTNDGADLGKVWDSAELNEVREAILANKVHRVCAGAGCVWVSSAIPDETLRYYAQIDWHVPQGFVPERTRRLAALGQRDALYTVGIAHLNDNDSQEAMRWLEEAAKRGSELAAFTIAVTILNAPKDVQVDWNAKKVRAAKLLARASDAGYGPASMRLAQCYEKGEGVKLDFTKAQQLFKLGAERGDPMGWLNLANRKTFGLGTPSDFEEAIHLLTLAKTRNAQAGGKHSAVVIKEIVLATFRLALELLANPKTKTLDLSGESTRAVSLLADASAAGYGPASVRLGRCYQEGVGVERNFEKALGLFKLGAERGDAMGFVQLSSSYNFGKGIPRDFKEATRYLALAEARGASGLEKLRADIEQEIRLSTRPDRLFIAAYKRLRYFLAGSPKV